jgi:hypothetical protein
MILRGEDASVHNACITTAYSLVVLRSWSLRAIMVREHQFSDTLLNLCPLVYLGKPYCPYTVNQSGIMAFVLVPLSRSIMHLSYAARSTAQVLNGFA